MLGKKCSRCGGGSGGGGGAMKETGDRVKRESAREGVGVEKERDYGWRRFGGEGWPGKGERVLGKKGCGC